MISISVGQGIIADFFFPRGEVRKKEVTFFLPQNVILKSISELIMLDRNLTNIYSSENNLPPPLATEPRTHIAFLS